MRRVVTKKSNSAHIAGWLHPPPYIMNVELECSSTEKILFADWTELPVNASRIDPIEETLLFKQLNFCAYRLSHFYQQAARSFRPSINPQYDCWASRYHAIRQRLIDANIGLVYNLLGRSRFMGPDHDELLSEGMIALLRAVDTFDPWRGFRLSTYACNAILRAFAKLAYRDVRRRSTLTAEFDPEFEKSDFPETRRAESEMLYVERLSEIMRNNRAELSHVEREVLSRRFPAPNQPLEYYPRPTLDRVGRQMLLSKERIRKIEFRAFCKLRRAIGEDAVLS